MIYTQSSAVFACHSAACIPPPSGGTGGSDRGGSAPTGGLSGKHVSIGRDGSVRVRGKVSGDYRVEKVSGGYAVHGPEGKRKYKTLTAAKRIIVRKMNTASKAPATNPASATKPSTGNRHWINSNREQSRSKAWKLNADSASGKDPALHSDGSVTYHGVNGKEQRLTRSQVTGIHPVDLYSVLKSRGSDMNPTPGRIVKHLTGWTVDQGGNDGAPRAYRDGASGTEFLPGYE